jgi:transcriptional regulator with XRE-family HTH domain
MRNQVKDETFARALDRLMASVPGGRMTISELSRRTGLPRSTIHRHLRGGQPQRDTLDVYARALGVPVEELAGLAGFRVESEDPEVIALAEELRRLTAEQRQAIWEVVRVMRNR